MGSKKNIKKVKRYIKLLGVPFVVGTILLGGIHYYSIENQKISILADSGLKLTTSKNEVTVNSPFIVNVTDTGATNATSDSEDLESEKTVDTDSEQLEVTTTEPIKQISKTVIYLPLGIEFDEVGTNQLNDGKK